VRLAELTFDQYFNEVSRKGIAFDKLTPEDFKNPFYEEQMKQGVNQANVDRLFNIADLHQLDDAVL